MKNIIVLTVCVLFLTACTKQDEWLNIKSNKGDIIPTTLQNFQAILDNDTYLNDYCPGIPLVSADNYYLLYTTWLGIANYGKTAHVWAQDVYQGSISITDWSGPYVNAEYANIVLEGLDNIQRTSENQLAWDNLKGAALFYRSFAFYNLVNEFASPYSAATAATDLGIPLRLSSDINVRSVRASVEEVYQQIIRDLKQAVDLLPVSAQYQSRPGKAAAEALLAKTYLTMDDYANAGVYADKSLNHFSTLIDFNTLALSATKPFPVFPNNPEIIFYATSSIIGSAIIINGLIDSTLLKSYAVNDLRKTAFYVTGASGTTFKGQYSGMTAPFGGLATNELYLIRAESNARLGKTAAAIQDLNTLLIKRWKTGSFLPYAAISPDDALLQVLTERRKELPFTGTIRWDDLRRLNKDPRFARTLTRNLNGQIYTLPPLDPKYVLPIPETEIRLSGIQQNPR